MKNWLLRAKCFFSGHKVVTGPACPVTGIVRLDCNTCGSSNMPRHINKEGMFQ